jgi:multimeric flavodoxin WrbA
MDKNMKVLLLNGSPRKEGCTYRALTEVARTLNAQGIETEIFQAGKPDMECVKEGAQKMKEADALVVGSPVYWASPSGQIIEFMDKFCSLAGKDMYFKPAAAVASARRAGTTATLDVLIKYFTFHQMPVVSSNYWNMVHGNTPEEVEQDLEGLQIMQVLGNNMAWLLKCLEAGEKAGISQPQQEEKIKTNFIR